MQPLQFAGPLAQRRVRSSELRSSFRRTKYFVGRVAQCTIASLEPPRSLLGATLPVPPRPRVFKTFVLGQLGTNLGRLGANLGQLGANLGQLEPNLRQLWVNLHKFGAKFAQVGTNVALMRTILVPNEPQET